MVRRRSERIAEAIRREISMMLQEGEIKDPRIGFVTIVRVEVSGDLREVKVYMTHYGKPSERSKSLEGFKSASGFIEGEVARRLRLRIVPHISFMYDEKIEKTINVLKIMDSLHSDEE